MRPACRPVVACLALILMLSPAALAAADPIGCAVGQVSAPARAAMAGVPGAGASDESAAGQGAAGLRVMDVLAARPAAPDSLPLEVIAGVCGLPRDGVTDALVARGLAFRAVEEAATARLAELGAPADAATRALARMSPAYRSQMSARLARAAAYDITRFEDRAMADGVRRARAVTRPVQLPHLVRAMLAALAQQGVAACLAAPPEARAACAGLADWVRIDQTSPPGARPLRKSRANPASV